MDALRESLEPKEVAWRSSFLCGRTREALGDMAERRFEEDALEWCRDERDRAIETLRLIEEEGWTFHEAQGDLIMRDVTDKRANRQRQIIERMDRIIGAHEALEA